MRPAQGQDVIEILLDQHQRVRELLAAIKSGGSRKQQAFANLRDLLASHEEAEEAVVRPVTRRAAGDSIADVRNEEQEHADEMPAALGKLDISSAEFDTMFADFQNAVAAHAEHEEADEFPRIKASLDHEQLVRLGHDLLAAD
ncbi:MAG: hemerythrin domain-containing protein [Streptosporangiaceae bacterium]